jgi:hypothetical protein
MADACTIVRPARSFHPISEQVPTDYIEHISSALCTTTLLPSEDSGPLSTPKYKVEKRDDHTLFPGLHWDRKDNKKKHLPELLNKPHSRIKHIQESPIAISCRKEVELSDKYLYPILIAGLILWSDGLNPNSSSKDHRGSVWTLLATLVLNWEKKNPGAYTYPLAVGPDVSTDELPTC